MPSFFNSLINSEPSSVALEQTVAHSITVTNVGVNAFHNAQNVLDKMVGAIEVPTYDIFRVSSNNSTLLQIKPLLDRCWICNDRVGLAIHSGWRLPPGPHAYYLHTK